MSRNRNKCPLVLMTILIVSAACISAPGWGQPTALTQTESDGYLQWLHSLEQTVAGREGANQAEGNLLFPFERPASTTGGNRPYRHLTIAKAVTELEHSWNTRAEGVVQSPLLALSHARNYMQLSEYDSSQAWFDAAAALDSSGSFRREIGRESLGTAIAAGDSLRIHEIIVNTLGTRDLEGRDGEIVLAFRWLLTQRDSDGLKLLLQKIEGQTVADDDRVVYWRAFSLAWLDRRSESLDLLRSLVAGGGLSRGLSEAERSWVLVAMADIYFLTGRTADARALYTRLAASSLEALRVWGQYQLAGLDFVAMDYRQAAAGFQDVCDGQRLGAWQDQACAMSELAEQLAAIRNEGERYGINAYANP